MKLRRCFIDGQGNIWRDSTLIEAARGLPVKSFEIGELFDEMIRWKITNLRDYVVHFKRVLNADLSIPIILNEKGYPMDGWHRIIKALAENKKVLPSKQFIEDPQPDFRNE